MAKKTSIIDPITRIEGHLRAEMTVEDGVVTEAWVSGGCFRGMELVVRDRTPEDAAHIVQRICGVCPVSHGHAATIAAEHAYGIVIPNNARILRNLIEGAQYLHSHILSLYTLTALDYVNPLNALKANVADAYDLVEKGGTSIDTDLSALKEKLKTFADNGQLSIFSGGWFLDKKVAKEYKMSPEADLICTAHYIEALSMQAKASEICGLLGGKMPHVMTLAPGGIMFMPTAEKLDDLWSMVHDLNAWVENTILPDIKLIASFYGDALKFGKGCGRYAAWGVFEGPDYSKEVTPEDLQWGDGFVQKILNKRYMPGGIVDEKLKVHDVDYTLFKEYVGHSWYEGDSDLHPDEGETHPLYTEYYKDEEKQIVNDRYTWSKSPSYDGKPIEAGPFSRVLVAYLRGVEGIKKPLDGLMKDLGISVADLQSTLGRTAGRQIETLYVSRLMCDWVDELCAAIKEGDSSYFVEPKQLTGRGVGLWEAPRGALLHTEHVTNGKIDDYQIIIPTTWNIAARNADGVMGPMEQALVGCPVDDVEMPINALRTVHSFDPCTACAVHVTDAKTGKHFETVTNPWGVK